MGELAVIFSAAELACCKCSNATFKICCLEEDKRQHYACKSTTLPLARNTSPVRSCSAPLHGPPCKGKKAHAPTTVVASTTTRRTGRFIFWQGRTDMQGKRKLQGKRKIAALVSKHTLVRVLWKKLSDVANISGWKVIEGIEYEDRASET